MDARKIKFDPLGALNWRPVNRHADLVTEVAFDGPRVHQRQRNIAALTDYALDYNKELAAEGRGFSPDRSMKRIAHLTPATIMWLREEKGIDIYNPDHMDGLRRILNDPEYRHLRTSTGAF